MSNNKVHFNFQNNKSIGCQAFDEDDEEIQAVNKNQLKDLIPNMTSSNTDIQTQNFQVANESTFTEKDPIQIVKDWKLGKSEPKDLEDLSKYLKGFQNLNMCLKQDNFKQKISMMMEKATFQQLTKGEFLFHAGQKNNCIFFILLGKISSFTIRKKKSKDEEENPPIYQKEISRVDQNSQNYILTLKNDQIKNYFDKSGQPKFDRVKDYEVKSCIGQASLTYKRFSAVVMSESAIILKVKISDFDEIFDYTIRKREYILDPLQKIFEGKIRSLILEDLWSLFEDDGRNLTFGDFLYKEGDVVDKIFLVKEGTFQLTQKIKGENQRQGTRQISMLIQGEIFGFENALLCSPLKNDNFPTHEFSCQSVSENASVFFADIFPIRANEEFKVVREELDSKAAQKRKFYFERLESINKIQQQHFQKIDLNSVQEMYDQTETIDGEQQSRSKNSIVKGAFMILQKRLEDIKQREKKGQDFTPSQRSQQTEQSFSKFSDHSPVKCNTEASFHQRHSVVELGGQSNLEQQSRKRVNSTSMIKSAMHTQFQFCSLSSSQTNFNALSERSPQKFVIKTKRSLSIQESPQIQHSQHNTNMEESSIIIEEEKKNYQLNRALFLNSSPKENQKLQEFSRQIPRTHKQDLQQESDISPKQDLPKLVYLVSEGLPSFEESRRLMTMLRSLKSSKSSSNASLEAAAKNLNQKKENNQDKNRKAFEQRMKKVLEKKKKRGTLLQNLPSNPSFDYLGHFNSLPTLIQINSSQIQNQCNNNNNNNLTSSNSQVFLNNSLNQFRISELERQHISKEDSLSTLELKDTIFSLRKPNNSPERLSGPNFHRHINCDQDTTLKNKNILPLSLISYQDDLSFQDNNSSIQQQNIAITDRSNNQNEGTGSSNSPQKRDPSQEVQQRIFPSFQSGRKRKQLSSQLQAQYQQLSTHIAAKKELNNNALETQNKFINFSSPNKTYSQRIIPQAEDHTQFKRTYQDSLIEKSFNQTLYSKHKQRQSIHQKVYSSPLKSAHNLGKDQSPQSSPIKKRILNSKLSTDRAKTQSSWNSIPTIVMDSQPKTSYESKDQHFTTKGKIQRVSSEVSPKSPEKLSPLKLSPIKVNKQELRTFLLTQKVKFQ